MAYDPKDAVVHIVHDYVYLVASGTDTQRPLAHPFNHYAERTFHVHCRALAKFFSTGKDRRDMYAHHFTRTRFVRTPQVWDDWADHRQASYAFDRRQDQTHGEILDWRAEQVFLGRVHGSVERLSCRTEG
jgi:hypothetical protein